MMRSLLMMTACLVMGAGIAQEHTVTEHRSYAFSDGVHPTIVVVHADADLRTVEDHWRGVLKGVSRKVSGRREIIGMTALIPEITTDTVRVLVKGEQPRGVPSVTLHVAFLTTHGYLGPGSDSLMVRGAREFVRRHALALRMGLATKAVSDAERTLSRLRRELGMLVREKERAEGQRGKSILRDSSAVADQVRLAAEITSAEASVGAKREAMRADHTVESEKELKMLVKQRDKLQARHASAIRSMETARKRTTSLEESIRRNQEAQVAKEAALVQQEAHLEELRARREAIH